ncbi:helix-turn-helix domain-containing protein [Rheinheimera sp.]|uniref:AraC family transcriptional regulator n=1 Tax=Rheinheimera sp. TaxID=1869214 RepID=UPI003AF96CDF
MLSLSIRQYSPQLQSHQHEFTQLVLPLTGVLKLAMPAGLVMLHPGEVVFIAPGTEHGFAAQNLSRFLVLDLAEAPAAFANYSGQTLMLPGPITSYLSTLEQLLLEPSPLLPQAGQLLLDMLCQYQLQPRLDQRLQRAMLYMQQNLGAPLDLVVLADKANLSLSQFKQLFRQQLQQTPGDYLTQLRMQQARQLLQFSDLPVQRIAQLCGYTSASAFSARFRQQFQQKPKQYRELPPSA